MCDQKPLRLYSVHISAVDTDEDHFIQYRTRLFDKDIRMTEEQILQIIPQGIKSQIPDFEDLDPELLLKSHFETNQD